MARLDLEAAPPTALPAAALTLAAGWGVAAGLLLAVDGGLALASRWGPSTLALVHALTLGLFGNAAAGALLQFLPAAAGVRPAGGPRAGAVVLVLLNAGAALLVAGFRAMREPLLLAGGLLAAVALAGLVAATLPPLLRHRPRSALHAGLAIGVGALGGTAAWGLAMLLALSGRPGLAPARWIDVHAAWGLGGAMPVLLASIAQQVMPMFHGAPAMPVRRFGAWLGAVVASLAAVAATRAATPALALLGLCLAIWAGSTLARLARPLRPRRNPALVHGWRIACGAAVAAVAAGLFADARAAGAIALAIALPLFLVPMLLEISTFLCWLGLHRAVGARVPGTPALQPEHRKAGVVAMQAIAGVAVVAALPGGDPAARVAGVLVAAAHLCALVALARMQLRARQALRGVDAAPSAAAAGPDRA